MFGIGSTEILVILVVALLVLGPKKLPEIARTLGKGLGEFRRVTSDFQRTINTEVEQEDMERRKKEAEEQLFGDKAKEEAKADDGKDDAPPPEATAEPDAVAGSTEQPDAADEPTVNEPVEELADAEPTESVAEPVTESVAEPEAEPRDKEKA